MIVTHPFLFNAIVVLFIAFTGGWMAYVLTGRRAMRLAKKLQQAEKEKEALRQQAAALEKLLEKRPAGSFRNTPVIALSSQAKSGKTRDA